MRGVTLRKATLKDAELITGFADALVNEIYKKCAGSEVGMFNEPSKAGRT
jgi:hypothetical protein